MTTPARLLPLCDQYDFALDRLCTRLVGLSDDEYLWEPVTDCWSVRPRGRQRTMLAIGSGAWVLEQERPSPDPAPFPTIAWRVCHLAMGLTLRADYTVGSHSLDEQQIVIPAIATAAIELLATAGAAWRTVLEMATDADLDQVGRSQFPWGLDPELPLLDICWWVNQEVLHHGAEIALMRDLYHAHTAST